jgi:hypothetical protein
LGSTDKKYVDPDQLTGHAAIHYGFPGIRNPDTACWEVILPGGFYAVKNS